MYIYNIIKVPVQCQFQNRKNLYISTDTCRLENGFKGNECSLEFVLQRLQRDVGVQFIYRKSDIGGT